MTDLNTSVPMLRRALQEVCAAFPAATAELDFSFFSPAQLNAAEFSCVLVEGPCGTGKSHLQRALLHSHFEKKQEYRLQVFPRFDLFPGIGFGYKRTDFPCPEKADLQALLRENCQPLHIWQVGLLDSFIDISHEYGVARDWQQGTAWVATNPKLVREIIQRADQEFNRKQSKFIYLFDGLEQMADTEEEFHALLKGILQLAVELLKTENLRCKIFVQPWMMENIRRETHLAEHLLRHKKELSWRRCDLYHLLFNRLANHSQAGPYFRSLYEKSPLERWQPHPRTSGKFVAPRSLAVDETAQAELFQILAGPEMGEFAPNAVPYVWLINYLQDSAGMVSPRSFMAALAAAAQATAADCPTALDGRALAIGVRNGWQTRVAEIEAHHPWVKLALAAWRKQKLPLSPHQIERLWQEQATLEALPGALQAGQVSVTFLPAALRSGASGVISQLAGLGMVQVLLNGDIQMNDVYRLHYGLGRHSGLPIL